MNEWLLNYDLDRARTKYVSPLSLAFDYARLADKEETLRALNVAYRERSPWLIFLQKEPVFDFIHSDERYRALAKKMGLPPAQQASYRSAEPLRPKIERPVPSSRPGYRTVRGFIGARPGIRALDPWGR
jgi:hypothetical protein